MSNSRWQKFWSLISRKVAELGHMLLLNINRKKHIWGVQWQRRIWCWMTLKLKDQSLELLNDMFWMAGHLYLIYITVSILDINLNVPYRSWLAGGVFRFSSYLSSWSLLLQCDCHKAWGCFIHRVFIEENIPVRKVDPLGLRISIGRELLISGMLTSFWGHSVVSKNRSVTWKALLQ